jgi:hypothetical protein
MRTVNIELQLGAIGSTDDAAPVFADGDKMTGTPLASALFDYWFDRARVEAASWTWPTVGEFYSSALSRSFS